MPNPFDEKAEDAKLKHLHQEEEEDVARILSGKYSMTYTDLGSVTIDMEALRLIPEAKAHEAEAVAFNKEAKHLSLAIRNPNNPALAGVEKDLEDAGFILEKFLVSTKSLEDGLSRYHELSNAVATRKGVITISPDELAHLSKSLINTAALASYLEDTIGNKHSAEVSALFQGILTSAFAMKASDIHLEPEELGIRLRFRLDGVLEDMFTFDTNIYKFLNSRLKLVSGLKLNVHDRAQDGRFSVDIGGSEIEVRTSLIPGSYGESFVLRILNPDTLQIGFENLGINPKLFARLEEEIKRPNGMLLTTGPTGSGKTTTLYAFLKKIHTPDIKIVTIEDPIEYHLPGIVQTQTNEKDYTFALGLRSIVRQDPDVIMVGEIRDAETAGIAIQAALTGHFVFSTLHTNDAAGTFPRLADFNIDPKEFASAVTVAMAQRLVRKLDPNACKKVPLIGESKAIVDKVLASIVDKSLIPADVSSTCIPEPKDGSTGYKGRVGLYEAIFMDDELGTFLRDNPSASDIRKHVARQGYLTMVQDGVLKALAGLTSLEEVLSVAELPRD